MERNPLEENYIKMVADKSGIYWIYVDQRFTRLKGNTDIIYIGRGKNLRKRLKTFLGIGKRKALPRFKRLQEAGFKLSFSYKITSKYKQLERLELNKFEEKHLELPPLNRHH